ncbi:helix-turn-helix transcriptional regulator [Gordonia rhizosphera]|uniref:HTH luxR-type domain-containing protein n=1 Tax=Gordonia rhizosphera NBRC 16068 TaxID=1108045 RepID=K6VNN5_9ACTN|nr:LuxR C-terminal-related transcriptional regulator [Gordonia rhizosphera]GAB88530.1 hypothetical protein GORHZ_026_00290 [Gordonia rhizosphera NBRC 16068]
MTADVNQDLQIPMHPLPPSSTVLIVAEDTLADVGLLALVERFGYRAALIDVGGAEAPRQTGSVVIVRSELRLAQLRRVAALASARVIGIGVPVGHLGGVELPDSGYSAGRLRQVLRRIAAPGTTGADRVHLSPREREVVVTYTLGSTVRETSQRYFISESTVRSHFRRVMNRYGEAGRPVNNKTQLLIQLIADGWVERDLLVSAV